MAEPFTISELPLAGGMLGLCPMPGRGGDVAGDLCVVLAWRPVLVIGLTEPSEPGANALMAACAAAGLVRAALPVADYGIPDAAAQAAWPDLSARARRLFPGGGRVLLHCMGGCGRSGMIALRLMIDAGEAAGPALARLRAARPCAVETGPQMDWALRGV